MAITIIDNASAPEARRRLGELVGGDVTIVVVVDAGANLGFGPGANVGLRRFLDDPAAGEWVAVAPHDALPAPDCLAAMLTVLRDRPATGLASADVGDGHVPIVDPYFGGMSVPAPASGFAGEQGSRWEPAGYPHGTLLLARRACLEEVGLFDERYFSYCEEADLGERSRRAGWDVAVVRGAEVRNPYLGGDAAVIDYLMLRNTLLLVRDHFGRYRATIRALIALGDVAHGILRPSRRPWIFEPRARLRALADHARGRYGPPPEGLRRR